MAKKRVKIDLTKLKLALPKARLEYNAILEDALGSKIEKSLTDSRSPVAGVSRMAPYSDSYKASIKAGRQGAGKKIRPINLKLSGALWDSQKIRARKEYITLEYTDPKAKYHNEGTPKMPRRPLLPTRKGEEFSGVIMKYLKEQAKKVLTQFL